MTHSEGLISYVNKEAVLYIQFICVEFLCLMTKHMPKHMNEYPVSPKSASERNVFMWVQITKVSELIYRFACSILGNSSSSNN